MMRLHPMWVLANSWHPQPIHPVTFHHQVHLRTIQRALMWIWRIHILSITQIGGTLAQDPWGRKQLIDMLRQEIGCHQPKLYHQQEHLLKVLTLLLKEEVDEVYRNICHRLHFLNYLDNHSLRSAVSYHKKLEDEDHKPGYFKYAELSTAVQEERGRPQYSGKEAQFIQDQAKEDKSGGGGTGGGGDTSTHQRGGRGRHKKGFPPRGGRKKDG